MYAIIQSGGKQHRVAAGETLKLEKVAEIIDSFVENLETKSEEIKKQIKEL